MKRPTVVVVGILLAGAAHGGDRRVEIREGSRVYGVLSVSSEGDRLILTYDGNEVPLGECADAERSKSTSTHGALAYVFERNCGATVDFATHVELRTGQLHRSVAVFSGRVPVTLRWTEEVLQVAHAPVTQDRVYRRAERVVNTPVTYTTTGAPAPLTEYVDYSSFNYGATGRASGIPAELLLRAAGWSQQASGVYRPEWGTWDGPPPYGDDPDGSSKIKDGIRYYEQTHKRGQR